MPNIDLMPIAGIDTESKDTDLVVTENRVRRVFVRDAINVDIRSGGDFAMRSGMRRVTSTPYRSLWRSPVHGETFGEAGGYWVRIADDWSAEQLAHIGTGPVFHIELNQKVLAAGDAGIFQFGGSGAVPLTIQTPGDPLVMSAPGSLPHGSYGFAVAWMRGDTESQLSRTVRAASTDGGFSITLPMCLDTTVTGFRFYMTTADGAELRRVGDYTDSFITVASLPELGKAPSFERMDPMPTGKYLSFWRGRLVTASANVLRFSEPLAYHIHDPRHGFVQMPQRITFVVPVAGGVWVGQVDHVAFLRGDALANLSLERKQTAAPVAGSSVLVGQDIAGELAVQGDAALWLSAAGYVIGGAAGEFGELHKTRLAGISGAMGCSVVSGQRVVTAVV
jgi:hypothetical protein